MITAQPTFAMANNMLISTVLLFNVDSFIQLFILSFPFRCKECIQKVLPVLIIIDQRKVVFKK